MSDQDIFDNNTMSGTRVRVARDRWYGTSMRVLVFEARLGKMYVAKPLEMEESTDPGLILGPTFHLPHQAAQELMDDLWQCGVRPSEGSGSAGAMRAVERHLEDMRSLAAKAMGVKFPGRK